MAKATIYKCPECGLHYANEAVAKQCEEFCKAHNACSMEITQKSIEAGKGSQSDF